MVKPCKLITYNTISNLWYPVLRAKETPFRDYMHY